MMNKKNVLITGATGFIGSNLVKFLNGSGYHVYCLIRKEGRNCEFLSSLENVEKLYLENFKKNEIKKLIENKEINYVVNLASYGVLPKDSDENLMIEGNITLLAELIEAIKGHPLELFIHTGTCSEYSDIEGKELLDEESKIDPKTIYGAAKASSVLYGNALCRKNSLPIVTLRLFGVYGENENENRIVPYVINQLKSDRNVELTKGEQVRDLTYIDDVVMAYVKALESGNLKNYEVYNICSGRGIKIKDVVLKVAEKMSKPKELLKFGAIELREGEESFVVGNPEKFNKATGWQANITIDEGIERMIALEENI